jgi:hypothetical protein
VSPVRKQRGPLRRARTAIRVVLKRDYCARARAYAGNARSTDSTGSGMRKTCDLPRSRQVIGTLEHPLFGGAIMADLSWHDDKSLDVPAVIG